MITFMLIQTACREGDYVAYAGKHSISSSRFYEMWVNIKVLEQIKDITTFKSTNYTNSLSCRQT